MLSSFDGTEQRLKLFYADLGQPWWDGGTVSGYDEIVRDPSIMHYDGKYWVIHTGYPVPAPATGFTLTFSPDLDTWAAAQGIATTEIPGAIHTWAPEWVHNEDGSIYLDPSDKLPRVTVSVNPNADFNTCCFSIYVKAPTDATMTAWSDAVQLTINDIGTENPIDPFVIKKNGTFYLWWKAQSGGNGGGTGYAPGYATGGSNLTDAYTLTQHGGGGSANWNWTGLGVYHEGPALLKMGTSWRLFTDFYANSFTAGQLYSSDSADDWVTWSMPKQIITPNQAKHGTVIPYVAP